MAILNVVILCLFSSSYPLVILLFCLVFHFGLVYDFWLGLVTLLAYKCLYSHGQVIVVVIVRHLPVPDVDAGAGINPMERVW